MCKDSNVKLGYNKYEEYFSFVFYREDRNVVINVIANVVLNENEKIVLELLKNKELIERIESNKTGYWKVKI